MSVMKMLIRGGVISTIHNDDVVQRLRPHGSVSIHRASHVEPDGDRFIVDLSPVKGPVIKWFDTHAAALECEQAWLLKNDWRHERPHA